MPETQSRQDDADAQALDLLTRHPLVDAHNDLPWVLRLRGKNDLDAFDIGQLQPKTDTDLPRLKAGRVATQVFAAYLPTTIANPATVTLEQIDVILRMEEKYADALHPVRTPGDVAIAVAKKKIGSIVSVEGTVGLEGSLAPLRLWHRLGVRLVTLCHNETLAWVDSATDKRDGAHEGLSDFGRSMIGEMNRLGLIIDLAHVAPHAMHKVLDASTTPVMITHSNATALCDHPRNTPDDVLARLPKNGGVIMATFVPEFLNKTSWAAVRAYKDAYGKMRLDTTRDALQAAGRLSIEGWNQDGIAYVCDHLAYFRDKVGEDHIGFGSDFFGGVNPPGLDDASTFPALIAELIRRKWTEPQLIKLIGGNFLRVWRDVERKTVVV
jgi:membrane dipeptidase